MATENKASDYSGSSIGLEQDPSLLNKINGWIFGSKKRIIVTSLILTVVIFLAWALVSKMDDEVAALSLSPSASSVAAGADFNLTLNLDTRNNNVVVVKGVVRYNPAEFELRGWNTSSSVFSSGNTCVYNSKPCEIVTEDAAGGMIIITEAKPAPGVKTASGQVATLTFRAKKALAPSSPNITVHYIAYGNYTDSDVIFDDGAGTDILSEVSNATVSASLPVPAGLSAVPASATGINLSWSAPPVNVGVTGYKIFRNNDQIGTSASTTYSDTGLTPLTAYQYKISAYDSSGHESAQTSQQSATTLADTTKPSKPANLAASNVQMDSMDLTWSVSTDDFGVAGYNIYQGTSKIGTVSVANYHVAGLTPNSDYTFSVAAFDVAGNESDRSDIVSAKTLADTQAPTVPGNVSAQAVSISQINLTWNVSTDNVGVTGYNIYRNGLKVGTSATASFNDTGLAVKATYTYQISAYDAKNNESNKSSQVSATTNSDTSAPAVPAGLTGTAASMTQINLSWTASADDVGVTGYRIFRDGTKVGDSETTTYQDTGLAKATPYSYTIIAYDAAGNQSAQTSPISVTTLSDIQAPTVPGGLAGKADSMTQITLTWNESTDNVGVAGYRLYRNETLIKDLTEKTYQDSGLTAGTSYSYTVSAYDTDGNESARSGAILVTTLVRKYGISDFTSLVADWMQTKPSPADISNDGTVNSRDLGIMMHSWE
jgi:chitodextrinase